jgi:transcriptional regulator with XRE-family HTH domain
MSLQKEIRAAMSEQEVTAYALSMKSGLDQGLLSRFFSEKSALSLKSLNILLDALGYELTIRRKQRKAMPENETGCEK